jgi:uncharacterized membrane protein required for colicin V production
LNALDFVILIALVAAGVGGWRQGIVARICIAVATVLGVLLAARNVGWITRHIPQLGDSPGILGVLLALAIGAIAGRVVGTIAGKWIRRRLPTKPVQQADRLLGAGAGALGTLFVVWLSGPLLGLIPGWPSSQWHGSRVATAMGNVLPAAPNPLGNARFAIAGARFPQIFSSVKQGAELLDAVGVLPSIPPLPTLPAALGGSPAAPATRSAGAVLIEASTCGVTSRGSGVVVNAPSLGAAIVLTTAHQVAGASSVTIDDGRHSVAGEVLAIDTRTDLALVRAKGSLEVLPLDIATVASPGVLEVSGQPIAIVTATVAEGRDIYGTNVVARNILMIQGPEATIGADDIGGAIVDPSRHIQGLVIALVPDRPQAAVALRAATLRQFLAGATSFPRTARCITN